MCGASVERAGPVACHRGSSSSTEEQRKARTRSQPCPAHGVPPDHAPPAPLQRHGLRSRAHSLEVVRDTEWPSCQQRSPRAKDEDRGAAVACRPNSLDTASAQLHTVPHTDSRELASASRRDKTSESSQRNPEDSTACPPRPWLLGPGHLCQEATLPTQSDFLPVMPSVRASPGLGAALGWSQMCLISGASPARPRYVWRLQHPSCHPPPQLPVYLPRSSRPWFSNAIQINLLYLILRAIDCIEVLFIREERSHFEHAVRCVLATAHIRTRSGPTALTGQHCGTGHAGPPST